MFNKKNLIHTLLIVFLCQQQVFASTIVSTTTNQNEQDKARQAALTPQQQAAQASLINTDRQTLTFPKEENCRSSIIFISILPSRSSRISFWTTLQLRLCIVVWGLTVFSTSPWHYKMS